MVILVIFMDFLAYHVANLLLFVFWRQVEGGILTPAPGA